MASLVAEAGEKVIPPVVVFSAKLTVSFASGAPPVSSTRKVTIVVSVPPLPLMLIFVGIC